MEDLKRIERSALAKARRAKTLQDVHDLKAEILGKKGVLGQALRTLGELPPVERPQAGERINALKAKIEGALDEARTRIETESLSAELSRGAQDVTLPGRRVMPGLPHPIRLVEGEIVRALEGLGFVVAEGPLVEHDWYNFEALNFPPDHPARDAQDTFFIADKVMLRTHTSNVQVRTMLKGELPIRILAPGMVFRHDEIDATHTPCFHQIEGLWVDDRTTFADLKGVLHVFASRVFGPERRVRFRPSFFPFTEPSAEMDVSCALCGGAGGLCRPCKGTGWIEIMGAGMVDPAVFEAVGLDPEKVQGYAFGMGIERIALLKWGVEDIRLFYENDLRFLEQFSAQSHV